MFHMFMRKDLKSESEVSFIIQPGFFWFIIWLAAKMFGVPFPKVQSQVATSKQEVWTLITKKRVKQRSLWWVMMFI